MTTLRELEAAATPGPWPIDPGWVSDDDEDHAHVDLPAHGDLSAQWFNVRTADAALIVALRNAAPALLDIIDAASLLAEDTEHKDHNCGDVECPVARVRAALDRLPS